MNDKFQLNNDTEYDSVTILLYCEMFGIVAVLTRVCILLHHASIAYVTDENMSI